MTDDDNIEIVRVYAHDSNDDELAYELADAFAHEDERFHRRLRGLAYEVEVYYEIDTHSGEIELIGMKDGSKEIGRCPDPTWTPGGNDPPDTSHETDGFVHSRVRVPCDDGQYRTVCSCEVTDYDINDDGTINYPPSGTCDHQ